MAEKEVKEVVETTEEKMEDLPVGLGADGKGDDEDE